MSEAKKTVLVCGGAGFIGSHTCVALIESGYVPVVWDNLCNSSKESLERVAALTGHRPQLTVIDLCNSDAVVEQMARLNAECGGITCVILFAALKAVGESVSQPLRYYQNNLVAALNVFQAMAACGVARVVFSSSATVYGNADTVPVLETSPAREATNPYGHTKVMIEQILSDMCHAQPALSAAILRYFNPIGAHPSGTMGEDPNGIPNNLAPYLAQVAIGKREFLTVFGNDWPTPDGTGVRDYIHVCDLADGHVAAVRRLEAHAGSFTVNLGTGKGYRYHCCALLSMLHSILFELHSVLDLLKAMESACGRSIPYKIGPRRVGDVASLYANPERSKVNSVFMLHARAVLK
jgi:UDP-glucose 4-epimerase